MGRVEGTCRPTQFTPSVHPKRFAAAYVCARVFLRAHFRQVRRFSRARKGGAALSHNPGRCWAPVPMPERALLRATGMGGGRYIWARKHINICAIVLGDSADRSSETARLRLPSVSHTCTQTCSIVTTKLSTERAHGHFCSAYSSTVACGAVLRAATLPPLRLASLAPADPVSGCGAVFL